MNLDTNLSQLRQVWEEGILVNGVEALQLGAVWWLSENHTSSAFCQAVPSGEGALSGGHS